MNMNDGDHRERTILAFLTNPMKTSIVITCLVACLAFQVRAEEPDPSIAGLAQAAEIFVTAYNAKDAAALAGLFTENGEIIDIIGEDIASGREAIKILYEETFADENAPSIAIEVSSVRIVAPNLAIEDGTFHLTPPGDDNAPKKSTTYTASLHRNEAGVWQIASTRDLKDVTDAAGQLAALANVLKGDWTCSTDDGVRLDLAFGWDPSGKYLTAAMLTTTSDSEPQTGIIRIAWDAARKTIASWMFDSVGGISRSTWTATDDGWVIRTESDTGDGETITETQELLPESSEVLVWRTTGRLISGEPQPDTEIRIVRQAPDAGLNPDAPTEPAVESEAIEK